MISDLNDASNVNETPRNISQPINAAPPTSDDLRNALISMGDDLSSVMATLREAGIKGYRYNRIDCPIARYLSKILKAPIEVFHTCSMLSSTSLITYVPNPPAVLDFIDGFESYDCYRLPDFDEFDASFAFNG